MREPDAIIVLSAGIKQDANGRWVSTELTAADDAQSAPGGILRILATAVLARQYPQVPIVPSGGKGFNVPKDAPETRPLLCEIMRDELVEAGVAAERIMLEGQSNTTYQQLQKLSDMSSQRGWRHVLIVTSRYHIDRLSAMIKVKFHEWSEASDVQIIAAEDVLIRHDAAQWESLLRTEYEAAYMQARQGRERAGTAQIYAGSYQFK